VVTGTDLSVVRVLPSLCFLGEFFFCGQKRGGLATGEPTDFDGPSRRAEFILTAFTIPTPNHHNHNHNHHHHHHIIMFGFGRSNVTSSSSTSSQPSTSTNQQESNNKKSSINKIHHDARETMKTKKVSADLEPTTATTTTTSILTKKKPLTSSKRSALRSTMIQLTCVALVVSAITLIVNSIAHHGIPDIDPQKVHKAIKKAGYLGIVIYIIGFGLAELLHLPGLVFVTAGVMCWGHVNGWLLALFMAPLSCTISFLVVRRVGGQALADVQFSIVKRMMSHLDDRPVLTVVGLRSVFFLAPAINYILALSTIRARDFVAGTAIGLVLPLTVAVYFIDNLINYMGWGRNHNSGGGGGGISGV